MCGIVGLFLKDTALEPELGALLETMLVTLSDRGPDSAGLAIYGAGTPGRVRLTVQSAEPDAAFDGLDRALGAEIGAEIAMERRDTHAVLHLPAAQEAGARAALAARGLRLMSAGERIEIYKEVGQPAEVARRFGLSGMRGRHGVGHTRMATESAVTTMGAHPFSTGPDQCLVHNGSLSNPNGLRRRLARAGQRFETENDSEVAAAFLTHAMAEGRDLGGALEQGLEEMSGFFTFVVGTRDGFGVLRDPVACKPAVMAETEGYVAFGSEYRALAGLPGIEQARVWEPEPATVYFWRH